MSKDKDLKDIELVVRKDLIKGKKFPIPNVFVEWCHLVKPDTGFGKSQWELTLRLPEKLAFDMRAAGFNVRHTDGKKKFKAGDEEYYFIVAYRKTVTSKGVELTPPKVFERDGKTIFEGLIGNGSKCNVKISAKYLEISGETKLPCRLVAIQLVDLVEFGNDGFSPLDDEGDADDFGGDENQF